MNRHNLYILIDGPDNVGKTTLIRNLKNHFNNYTLHTLHYSNVRQDSPIKTINYSTRLYNEMFKLMVEQIGFEKSGFICDRSHLGEMVYGPIYRNYTGEYVLDIEKNYSYFNPVWDNLFLITLYDDAENLIERDDGLSFTTELEKKNSEINNFLNAHNKSTIKHKLALNIKNYNAEQAVKVVTEFIESTK